MHALHSEFESEGQSLDPDALERKRYFSTVVELLVVLRKAKWDYFEESGEPKENKEEQEEQLTLMNNDSWFDTLVDLQSASEWWLGPDGASAPTPLLCTAALSTAFTQCRCVHSLQPSLRLSAECVVPVVWHAWPIYASSHWPRG